MYEITNNFKKPQEAILGIRDVIYLTKKTLIEITDLKMPESDIGFNYSEYLENKEQARMSAIDDSRS